MNLKLRPGTKSDGSACAAICYSAFSAISDQHNFPRDFPGPEVASGFMDFLLSRPGIYAVVAEVDGKIAGSNFMWELCPIAGIGPITVDTGVQNASVGRRLMEHVLARAAAQKHVGVRLVQAAYHNRSLSLYTKLGFAVREPLSVIQGPALGWRQAGWTVRAAVPGDLAACNALHRDVHGFERGEELMDGIHQGFALVVERDGAITGYASTVGFFGYSVARTNDDLKALIGGAPVFHGPGFLLPSRNHDVMRWCLARGLRVVQPLNLMSIGLYNEPAGAFMPSILF